MSVAEWLGWTVFSIIAIAIIGFSLWFVHYYKLKNEPAGVTGVIGFLALLFAIISLFLVPIDVYMVKNYSMPDQTHNNSYDNNTLYAYYSFYVMFMFFLFIGLPFGYFYYEELGDLEDKSITCAQRSCAALKYTAAAAFIWIVLIVIGLFVDMSSKTTQKDDKWTHTVANRFSSNTGAIMPFSMAVLTGIGMFFSMIYTAWGLAAFPISLMKNMPVEKKESKGDVQMRLKKVSEQLDLLYTKYRGENEWNTRDRVKKNKLERDKKNLQKTDMIADHQEELPDTAADKCMRFVWSASAPIRYLVGMTLLGFSVMLVVSITLHLVDQVVNSSCGYTCGWALADPKLDTYNPTSYILAQTAVAFPIDYILFSIIIFWLFWCTIFGLMMIDVRFLCFKLFSLAPHQTMHNALLMAIGFIILTISSFNYLMMELATRYMTFGDQRDSCTVDTDDAKDMCPATQIYYILSVILVGMPIFGLLYFIMSWMFVLVFMLSFVYNIYRRPKLSPRRRLLGRDSDEDLEAIFRD